MESPGKDLLKLLVEYDPASPEFRERARAILAPTGAGADLEIDLWRDVFVHQPLPYRRFLQSAVLHGAAFALIWVLSLAWLRQHRILDHPVFDRSSLVTYTPEEYLPPLDTGAAEAPKTQAGDPVYAKQAILSVPREADNRSQTIVVPPDLKLHDDVPMPNIVATGAVTPAVPLDATEASRNRLIAPDTQVVAPAPEVQFAANRVVEVGLKSEIIAPPPEVSNRHAQGLAGPETAVVEPPPEVAKNTAKRKIGDLNVGPSTVVAPAPQLALAEQRSLAPRGSGTLPGGGMQPVAPPPAIGAAGGGSGSGRLVALGIRPVAPTGPVAVPAGNRRGAFSANPQGKPGASGTPELTGSKSGAQGTGIRGNGHGGASGENGSLPAGLHVDAMDGREIASASTAGAGRPNRVASPVAEDKITEVDRQVFGGKRFYSMTLNMPNLNSSTGSWDIRFAELRSESKPGELLAPVATETSDPGYPLELIRANVHGMVTLYAVIHSDGRVGNIKVLNSPDDRLDNYAAQALGRWKFLPAERDGKPVALEAVVKIPFRVRRNF